MLSEFSAHWAMWASLAIVAASIILYMMDRWSMELISLGVVAALLVLFLIPGATGADGQQIDPGRLIAGFGNPALITIMALLVLGQGLFQTGALDTPTRALLASYDKRPVSTMFAAFGAVFVTSAFINNTPVVVMFLPVMSAIAARMNASPSKLMMPLSFVGVFAGMTTLIGTSTNLLAADSYRRLTGDELGFFTQTPLGLVLAGAGLVYLVALSAFLLPSRADLSSEIVPASGKHFIAQIEVTHGHFLSGKRPIAGMFADLPGMTVRMVQRGEHAFLPPYDDLTLQPGDLVIVAATRHALTDVFSRQPELLQEIWRSGGGDRESAPRALTLTEAVVAPGSRMVGRTIENLGFRRLTKSVVLGIQRRSQMIRARLGEIRLEAGDTLLMCGPPSAFSELRASRDLILLEWSSVELPVTARAQAARVIAVLTVLAAASGVLPILHASVLGAFAMIAASCLNIRQAGRALDLRIFMLIGAAIAMATALETTGAAGFLAMEVVEAVSPYGPLAMLSALFLLVAILTNILSNAATAVLFTPIALEAAKLTGAEPLPYVLAVIYAANCCFATPIAYQTNLLVMGPGHYRFLDYVRFGGPLVFLLWCVFTAAAPWRFGLSMT